MIYSTVDNHETGIAESLYRLCLDVSKKCWRKISASSSLLPTADRIVLREAFGSLYLWTPSPESGGLDKALAKSDDLKNEVLSLLVALGKVLAHSKGHRPLAADKTNTLTSELAPICQSISVSSSLGDAVTNLDLIIEKVHIVRSGHEDVDNDSEEWSTDSEEVDALDVTSFNFIYDISSYVSCLMELLPTLERSLMLGQRPAEAKELSSLPTFCVSGPAAHFVYHIRDKFKTSDVRLAQRLGEANWQRYVRIRRQMAEISMPGAGITTDDTPSALSLFVPRSMFHNSGLGVSVSALSAALVLDKSTMSRPTDIGSGNPQAPITPAEVQLGEPFQCEICGHTLLDIKSRVDWM